MGDELLNSHICETECLNESPDHPVGNLFAMNSAVLKSDVDQQLLIKCVFRQPVRLSALRFTGVSYESAPSDVKVFMNKPNLVFADAEDEPATQEFSLTQEEMNLDGKGQQVALKFVKFQNVSSLQIFVSENAGGAEVTELKNLEIYGSTGEKSDISEWKPVKG